MTSVNAGPKPSTTRQPTAPATTTTATPSTTTTTTATLEVAATGGLDGVDSGAGPQRLGGLPAVTLPTTGPVPTTAPRRGLTPSTTLPDGITDDARASLQGALDGTGGEQARGAARELLRSTGYKALSSTAQATLLNTFAGADATATAQAATRLLSSSSFQGADAATRGQLVDVHAAASPQARASLLSLANSPLLANRDFSGDGTLLAHLHTLSTAPLAAGLDRAAVVSSTLSEVADPSSIEQLGQATCVATSVSLEVMRQSPAEYARLAAGLASPAGTVTLRSGDVLQRAAGSVADARSGRSPSERLIQDAFMERGNGALAYDVATDSHSVGGVGQGGGLTIAEAARLQSSVFGERFGAISTRGRMITRDATQGDVNLANLRNGLDKLTFKRAENQPMNRLRDDVAQGQPALAVLRWSSGSDVFHAVVVDRIDDDRVYFRNPHGNAYHGQAPGTDLDTPPRRVEAGNTQSMTVADFRARLDSATWQR